MVMQDCKREKGKGRRQGRLGAACLVIWLVILCAPEAIQEQVKLKARPLRSVARAARQRDYCSTGARSIAG